MFGAEKALEGFSWLQGQRLTFDARDHTEGLHGWRSVVLGVVFVEAELLVDLLGRLQNDLSYNTNKQTYELGTLRFYPTETENSNEILNSEVFTKLHYNDSTKVFFQRSLSHSLVSEPSSCVMPVMKACPLRLRFIRASSGGARMNSPSTTGE